MANAQNFFNATPAPDPQQNPLMAGLAGGLQGAANQGEYQKQLQLMQYQNQQKQISDMLNAGAQNRQAGFGPGPAGSTPMQIGGQPGYWDPNGMGPSGQMDMAKAQLYQTMNDQKSGNGMEAHTLATQLLKGIADKYQNDSTGKYGYDQFQGDSVAAMDFIKKKYGLDQQQEDQGDNTPAQAPAAMFNGRDASGKPVMTPPTAAQQMFSKVTGSSLNSSRAKVDPRYQSAIDNFKKQGISKDRIKTDLKAKGINPDDYNI